MTAISDKPFGEALRQILNEREWSIRDVTRRTQAANGWGSVSTIHQLLGGDIRPTYEAMEHIAKALSVPPEHFAEFRLAKARRALDPEAVGLRRALRNLEAMAP